MEIATVIVMVVSVWLAKQFGWVLPAAMFVLAALYVLGIHLWDQGLIG